MNRVEFRLSMPNRGSWNGGWSGEGRNYVIYKKLTNKMIEFLGLDKQSKQSWYYHWSDGWGANVSARLLEKTERKQKSNGFCGYDWMVESILFRNKILASHEITPNEEGK